MTAPIVPTINPEFSDPLRFVLLVLDTAFRDVADLAALSDEAYHEKIDELERLIFAVGSVEIPITHRFTPGLYAREMRAPRGTLITSLLHKTEHLFVISKGRALVYHHGRGWVEVAAPYTGITTPGTRRIIVAIDDLVWTTFHATDCTDPDEWLASATERRVSRREGIDPDPATVAPVEEEGALAWQP